MMIYDSYTKARNILRNRAHFWGAKAKNYPNNEAMRSACLDRAGAYQSAYEILQAAMMDDWDTLDQYDYYESDETEEWSCTPATISQVCEV